MKKKYSFSEPTCQSCPEYLATGNIISETRYCNGFPKKRSGKRFRSRDPRYKPPKWCPKRLASPVCRIYGYADEQSAALDSALGCGDDPRKRDYAYPNAWKYRLRLELPLGLTARQFWEAVQRNTVEDVLSEADLEYGEVVEIDDGLKPYYFQYLYDALIPVGIFDASHTVKPEARGEKTSGSPAKGGGQHE